MSPSTMWAIGFLVVGVFFLATIFRSDKKGRPPGRRFRAFRVVFAVVLLTAGLVLLFPTGTGDTVLHWIRFPSVEGLKLAGVHPEGHASLALPALSALLVAVVAYLVFGEKKSAR